MKDVEITQGVITLRKPLAGERNQAMIVAETPDGIKTTRFLVEILPKMIVKHPFGAEPVGKALDDLSIEDYDKLALAAGELVGFQIGGDVEKKSGTPSITKESLKIDG